MGLIPKVYLKKRMTFIWAINPALLQSIAADSYFSLVVSQSEFYSMYSYISIKGCIMSAKDISGIFARVRKIDRLWSLIMCSTWLSVLFSSVLMQPFQWVTNIHFTHIRASIFKREREKVNFNRTCHFIFRSLGGNSPLQVAFNLTDI